MLFLLFWIFIIIAGAYFFWIGLGIIGMICALIFHKEVIEDKDFVEPRFDL